MFQDFRNLHQKLQNLQALEFDSLKQSLENAKLCVAENVECDLSPIPGPADTWTGPNNA
jgi:hypothetical protein